MSELIQINSDERMVIPFVWRDPTPGGSNLGHAEFVICVRYKRGKPIEYWVTPAQQRDAKYSWHYTGWIGDAGVSFNSYQGLDNPHVWLTGWCSYHKAVYFSVYVPNNSAFLEVSGRGWHFWRTDVFGGEYGWSVNDANG